MNQEDFLRVNKPSRYLGGELNSVVKDLGRVRLKFALAFPDVYEVGMSHLGFQILYHILNREPEIACERVFVPWPDMEKFLQDQSLPLASLESSLPLKDFDIVGLSLQYELNYTGILNILHLSGIPFRTALRREQDPLIIGGGPCAMNPEPIADFFDALVLGDGEDVVLEICQEMLASRAKREPRVELLKRLARLEGVYIPSFFQIEYKTDGPVKEIIPLQEGYPSVRRRILQDLNRGEFPSSPILPFMEVIHDRLNIEIARGCSRGCRFCQAGMIYRPLRERSPQKILQLLEEGLKNTGYDEVSLLSLSTGDYSCIEPLLSSIVERYNSKRVAISLPSLRVETLTPSLIQQIQEGRKTGFTLAPEAGTERLRRVINKGNTQEDLLATIHTVFSAHWRLVKLYFMIGLPTENEEDLRGILLLCQKALREARRVKGSAQMNISISNFVPKTHTPFQWESQSSMEEVQWKQQFLRKNLERQGLRFKWSDSRVSFLEGVFARGDRRLSRVLEDAFYMGCRLDGWGDHFHYDLWEKAFLQAELDPSFYNLRSRELGEILPWDHLDSRINKHFLREERIKAFQEGPTADCRHASCNDCGSCDPSQSYIPRKAQWVGIQDHNSPPVISVKNSYPVRRFRSQFSKCGLAKFLGHLELSQSMIRAFRRSQIPLIFSQGFHPLPKISFGPPLPVGHESWAEFLDFFSPGNLEPQEVTSRLNAVLPNGISILNTNEIPLKSPSIFDNILYVFYEIHFLRSYKPPLEQMEHFNAAEKILVFWERKNKFLDLKSVVKSLLFEGDSTLKVVMYSGKGGISRPEEALDFIFDWSGKERPLFSIIKLKVKFKESCACPMKY